MEGRLDAVLKDTETTMPSQESAAAAAPSTSISPPTGSQSNQESVGDALEVEMHAVDKAMDDNGVDDAPESAENLSPSPEPHQDDISLLADTPSSSPLAFPEMRDALMQEAMNTGGQNFGGMNDDDDDMPGLEPLSRHSSPPPSNETSASGMSTPQRNNRRARVEDDHDDERDRRHPSERAAPRTGADNRPFGGVPFSLFGHRHNLNAPPHHQHNGSNAGASNNGAQAPQGQNNGPAQDWFSFAANSPNGVAITFDLLRGGPPTVRPVDESFRMHTHAHNHPPENAPPAQGTASAESAGFQGNAEGIPSNPNPGSGTAQTNNRDRRFFSADELVRQLRSMTDALTNALGGLESAGEDKERGKMLIRGLEELPEGLAKRMDAVAKAHGEVNGMGSCAICFDSLLEDAGFGGETDSPPPHASVPNQTPAGQAVGAEQPNGSAIGVAASPTTSGGVAATTPSDQADSAPSAETDDAPFPKIVALPCSHAFHASCLIPWFSKPLRTTCPSCRFDLDPEGLIWGVGRRPLAGAGVDGQAGGLGPGLGATAFGPFALPPDFNLFGPPPPRQANQTGPTTTTGTENAPTTGQPTEPFPNIHLHPNGMGLPFPFTDDGHRRANTRPQRRSQSVPRRRTQSLPREATQARQGAATDDMSSNGAGPSWARNRSNLPHLPAGSHRTVYHANLPMGGVDVVFDVIPINIPRNNVNFGPPQQPAAATGAPGPADANSVNASNGDVLVDGDYMTFGMDMLYGDPPTGGHRDDDNAMDIDISADDFFGQMMRRAAQRGQPTPSSNPNVNSQAQQPQPGPSEQAAQPIQPSRPIAPGVQNNNPPRNGARLGGFLQSLFGGFLPAQQPTPQSASAASGAAQNPSSSVPISDPSPTADRNAETAPSSSNPQPPRGMAIGGPLLERIVASTIGAVVNHVVAGMAGGFRAAQGASTTGDTQPQGQQQPQTAPPLQTAQTLPQPQPQAFEQAAATGLPSGIPAQLAQSFRFAPVPPLANAPASNTGTTPAEFAEMIRQYEPLLGPIPPHMMDDMRQDYEAFVAHMRHRHHLHHDGHTPLQANAALPPMPNFGSLTDLLRSGFANNSANPNTGNDPADTQPRNTLPHIDFETFTFAPAFPGLRNFPRQRSSPDTMTWSPPPAPGPTLRQRVERKEKEAGLRCDDVSCGVGPSDEDPVVSIVDASVKQLSIRHPASHQPAAEAGANVCQHTFHPACLVSAERVALQGNDEQVHGGEVEVTCPVCRHSGCIAKEDWDQGSQRSL